MKELSFERMEEVAGGMSCGSYMGLYVGLVASQVLLGFVTGGLTWYTAGVTVGYGGVGAAVACGE